ncbi:MAG: GNAT family N-acetyltransferase [Oscillospiraceae bacterium]|nr:GNAT family N-acetyltransferase [Oscillospiraceae bacterium]
MKIIQYASEYKQDFIDLNTKWITELFGVVEEHDKETFENIERDIENGAMIFFAVDGENVLACCMVSPMESGTWEICKLASNPKFNHKGCGSAVFGASVQWAIDKGAKRLFILSSTKLKPALHIYEKFGFHEIKLEDYGYARGDIALEKIVK